MAVLGFEDLKEQAGRSFVVHPTAQNSLTPLGFDLRIGQAFLLSQVGDQQEIVPTKKEDRAANQQQFCFPANSTSLVVTRERVWLSGGLMGAIHARGSLALRGLIINSTTVDPNWDGKMLMRIHNTSTQTEYLGQEDAFCTLVIHEVISSTETRPKSDPRSAVARLDEIYGTKVATRLYDDLHLQTSKSEDAKSGKLIKSAQAALKDGAYLANRQKYHGGRQDFLSSLMISLTGSASISLIVVYVLSSYPEAFPIVVGAALLVLLPLLLGLIIRRFSK